MEGTMFTWEESVATIELRRRPMDDDADEFEDGEYDLDDDEDEDDLFDDDEELDEDEDEDDLDDLDDEGLTFGDEDEE